MNRVLGLFLCWAAAAPVWGEGWRTVERILDRPGVEQGESLKVSFSRADLNVTVKGVPLGSGAVLESWLAFKPLPKGVLVLGDLLLLDSEVSRILPQLARRGFRVTALYSPFLDGSPSLKRVQISGKGSRSDLAVQLKQVLDLAGITGAAPAPTPDPRTPTPVAVATPNWGPIETGLGIGEKEGRSLHYRYPLAGTVTWEGMEIPPSMGLESVLCFQKEGERIAATGHLVLKAEEIEPAMESFSKNHVTATALHHILPGSEPGLYFLHFWALIDAKSAAAVIPAVFHMKKKGP